MAIFWLIAAVSAAFCAGLALGMFIAKAQERDQVQPLAAPPKDDSQLADWWRNGQPPPWES